MDFQFFSFKKKLKKYRKKFPNNEYGCQQSEKERENRKRENKNK
jgi:hypothetical protein